MGNKHEEQRMVQPWGSFLIMV